MSYSIKMHSLSKAQANAIAVWIEDGGFQKAFSDSKECSMIDKADADLGETNVEYCTNEFVGTHDIYFNQ